MMLAAGGVDVVVGQRAELAAAEPAQQRQPPQEGQPVIRVEVEEVRDLLGVPDERRARVSGSSSTANTGLNGILCALFHVVVQEPAEPP